MDEMKEDMEIIKKEVGEIIDRLAVIYDEEDTDSPEIQSEIERLGVRLKELTGKTIEECEPFHAYWSYTSLDTVVDRILMPELEVNAPFTKEQIIEIVKRIQECKYSSEAESDKDLMLLEKGVLDPNISYYIFWDNLTPEEIADKALSYKPIQL